MELAAIVNWVTLLSFATDILFCGLVIFFFRQIFAKEDNLSKMTRRTKNRHPEPSKRAWDPVYKFNMAITNWIATSPPLLLGAPRNDNPKISNKLSLTIPFLISTLLIAILLGFYLSSSVAIANVWLNSHQATPLIYKICGIWGNHEGSMLLFYTLMSFWSALLLRDSSTILPAIRLSSFILLAIASYIYLQANPFTALAVKAVAGQDLNPALQSPYLTIHPPILYAGQTLSFVLWIWACVDPENPRIAFYTRVCFLLLTLGLALGARWAYGELGWGGFWFWDPVETVSLFPWLAIAAALHTNKATPNIQRFCLLLAFPMVMLGLTLVRSGILVSVHSFGFDLNHGVWLGICAIMVSTVSALVLYKDKLVCHPRVGGDMALYCHPELVSGSKAKRRSQNKFGMTKWGENDSWCLLRTLPPLAFLGVLAILATLIIAPLLFKNDFAIAESFFHQYLNPGLLFLLIFCGLAPMMQICKSHGWSLLCAALSTLVWHFMAQPHFHPVAFGAAIAAFWIIFATSNHLKAIFSKGFVASHLGVGLCILGASHAEIFTVKQEFGFVELPTQFAKYKITHPAYSVSETPQVTREILNFMVDGRSLAPERQHFHNRQVTKHQTAWIRKNLDHIHATVFADAKNWKVELMLKPFISIFWAGIAFVLIGISVSIANSRKIFANHIANC